MSSLHCRPRKRNRAGFTLVEVMFAVSILVVDTASLCSRGPPPAPSRMPRSTRWPCKSWRPGWSAYIVMHRSGPRLVSRAWVPPPTCRRIRLGRLDYASHAQLDPDDSVVASPAADAWGWDQGSFADARFCVKLNYRVAHWTRDPPPSEDTVRVDVMVWRPRRGAANALTFMQSGGTNCNIDPNLLNDPALFKAVTSTLVRWQ